MSIIRFYSLFLILIVDLCYIYLPYPKVSVCICATVENCNVVVQCVGLLDAKAWVCIPGQSSKMKYENISSATSSLSRFLAKNLSFGDDVKLQVPPLAYKINAHNMSGVRSQVVILTEGVVMANYVCMYVDLSYLYLPYPKVSVCICATVENCNVNYLRRGLVCRLIRRKS